MLIKNPTSAAHLKISRKSHVLEVGGGHNPHPRSNIVVDKFLESNYHRSDDIKVYKNQKFLQADGENLPFKDNEFDYVICSHVLEHVEDPAAFLQEQCRVAKRGYLEVPSYLGECLVPKASHKWLILEIDKKIVLVDKEKVGFKPTCDLGNVFLDFMPCHSLGYKILQRTYGNLLTVRYEWENEIEFIVNPTEEKYLKYFRKAWGEEECEVILPQRGLFSELCESSLAFIDIVKSVVKSKVLHKSKPKKTDIVESSVKVTPYTSL